ncbi:PIN domain-containing protein [Candidatus Woesearchaeota archaeon]|nr:PIN domain-containing protein [Candidatus Woesearchaeota archaeon]
MKKVQITKEQVREARKISKQRNIPLGDAVHAVVAREYQAVLVSRDWDFTKVRDIVQTKKPEELV